MDKKFIKHILMVAFSNGVALIATTLTSFLIPRILGVEQFGVYKIFSLYYTYIGLAHVGFLDGILLKFSGNDYENLDKLRFRFLTKFLLVFTLVSSILILSIAFFFFGTQVFLVVLLLALANVALHFTTYFQIISQITSRFSVSSNRTTIASFLTIVGVLVLYFSKIEYYQYYILLTISINYILLIWYIKNFKEIVFGRGGRITTIEKKTLIIDIFKVGLPLFVTNLLITNMLNLDRLFVQAFYDNQTFAMYSFAYSLIGMGTVFTNSVSVVLFSKLMVTRRNDSDNVNIGEQYKVSVSLMSIFSLLALAGYFPLIPLITFILPNFIDSMFFFRVLFPGFVLIASVNSVKTNFYHVKNKTRLFGMITLLSLVISAILILFANLILKEIIYVSFAMVLGLLVWYVLTEIYFVKNYDVRWKKNISYILLLMVSFYLVSLMTNFYIGFLLYLSIYIVVTFSFHLNDLLIPMYREITKRGEKND